MQEYQEEVQELEETLGGDPSEIRTHCQTCHTPTYDEIISGVGCELISLDGDGNCPDCAEEVMDISGDVLIYEGVNKNTKLELFLEKALEDGFHVMKSNYCAGCNGVWKWKDGCVLIRGEELAAAPKMVYKLCRTCAARSRDENKRLKLVYGIAKVLTIYWSDVRQPVETKPQQAVEKKLSPAKLRRKERRAKLQPKAQEVTA